MLSQTLEELRRLEPTATASPARPAGPPTPDTVFLQRGSARPALPDATPATAPSPVTSGLQAYANEDLGFDQRCPEGWLVVVQPPAEIGIGIVDFRTPSGSASFTVSVEAQRQDVSPAIYLAHLETSLASLPGYQAEDVAPWTVSGAPAWRRLFSIRQGSWPEPLRTVHIVVARRSTLFILTGTAPASQFGASAAAFDHMVKSFRLAA